MGIRPGKVGVYTGRDGNWHVDVRPVYSFNHKALLDHGWNVVHPELDMNVIPHGGRLHFRNLFVNRAACQRFINRLAISRRLANNECNGYRTTELEDETPQRQSLRETLESLEAGWAKVTEEAKETAKFADAAKESGPSDQQIDQVRQQHIAEERAKERLKAYRARYNASELRHLVDEFLDRLAKEAEKRGYEDPRPQLEILPDEERHGVFVLRVQGQELPGLERVINIQTDLGNLNVELTVQRY